MKDPTFQKRLSNEEVKKNIDGLHVITILFQSARSRRMAKSFLNTKFMYDRLKAWDREWSERDISMFVYGVRSLEGVDAFEGKILELAAQKINESKAVLSSRAIGNALYGLQDISSSSTGAPELCEALADKIELFVGDLNGQDIGIGMYGLQGMSAETPEVRRLVDVLATKISASTCEFDSQAMSNALYGLQSMSSDHPEVLRLVTALTAKVGESQPDLCAQAVGSALYGMQKLSSDKLEVRSLVATLAEKLESSTISLDAQAIGNALFGLQRMNSNSAEVRSLVQAMANKLSQQKVALDSKGIGSALYGLHSMSSNVPQVRSLLSALAGCILTSNVYLSGQGIADALFGLSGMTTDCPELRSVLSALAERIDEKQGKLDSQEIGNALFGLQALSSEMTEARLIAGKLAEKLKRSKAVMLSQHIGRAMLGLQRLGPDSPEVRNLLRQLAKRIGESDRTRLTAGAIADSLFGLQGMTCDTAEVQILVGELAKKIAATGAEFTPAQAARALFGLQGFSSAASVTSGSAIPILASPSSGIDSDEVEFLLSAVWDKVKVMKGRMTLEDIAMGLQGLYRLRDPVSENMRQYLFFQLRSMEPASLGLGSAPVDAPTAPPAAEGAGAMTTSDAVLDKEAIAAQIIPVMRGLSMNGLPAPEWLATEYRAIEVAHPDMLKPILPQSRMDKLVAQRYKMLHADDKLEANGLFDGFRLDLMFRDIKFQVELDGPSHRIPARIRFDRIRDSYISSRGYEIMRLQLVGRSVDDLVSQIRDRVVEKTERMLDQEIQSMYAPDAAQLYTSAMAKKVYSPRKNADGEKK